MIEFDEEKHEYKVDGVKYPSVTDILEHLTAPGYGKVDKWVLEAAKERGTYIHEVTQDIDLGLPPEEIDDGYIGYIEAYMKFLADYEPQWDTIEEQFFCAEYGYCGTIDRTGEIDGFKCVLDIKTTASPTTDQKIAVCCQTVAYAIGIGAREADRYALYLHKDGTYELLDCIDYELQKGFDSENIFIRLATLHRQIEAIKKRRIKKTKEVWE